MCLSVGLSVFIVVSVTVVVVTFVCFVFYSLFCLFVSVVSLFVFAFLLLSLLTPIQIPRRRLHGP